MVVIHKRRRNTSGLAANSRFFRYINKLSPAFVVKQPHSTGLAHRQIRLPVVVKISRGTPKSSANSAQPRFLRNIFKSSAPQIAQQFALSVPCPHQKQIRLPISVKIQKTGPVLAASIRWALPRNAYQLLQRRNFVTHRDLRRNTGLASRQKFRQRKFP